MRLDVLHVRLKLKNFFETSFGRVYEQEAILIRLEDDDVVGWGEAPVSAGPFYSYEYVQTAWDVIAQFLGPKMRTFGHPRELPGLFRFVRGHNMAKSALEMAAWDLLAKRSNSPLSRMYGQAPPGEIPTGISLGVEDRIEDLLAAIEAAVRKGYRRIKVKIKPGWDVAMLREVRRAFPAVPLMADANGAYTLSDIDTLCALDELNLTQLEQPLAYDDMVDHAHLAKRLRTPICLDESIKSPDDGRKAIELGACRIINIKQARMGGPTRAIEMHDAARANHVPVWCGGLLETGIGRLHNVALATLPNFSMPGDVSASDRYWEEDLIDPPVELTPQGTLRVPTAPGIGYSVVESRVQKACVRRARVL